MKSCGGCNECCILLDIQWTGSPPTEVCPNCAVSVGCKVFDSRPQECYFQCLWLQDENAHPSLRPDRLHIMFEKLTENVVLATLNPKHELSEYMLRQVQAFVIGGSSVAINTFQGKPKLCLAAGMTGDSVWNVIKTKLEKYNNDSTKLHNKPEHS